MDGGFEMDTGGQRGSVGELGKWAALGGGSWMITRGLFKRSIVGIGMMFLGGLLLDRGLTGRWSTGPASGRAPRTDSALPTPRRAGERGREMATAADAYDRVDESSAQSFPASDSPSWTPNSRMGGPPRRPV